MPVDRLFLDWDAPLTGRVCDVLLADKLGAAGPPDFSDEWVVVPTRQAGRRLREAMARRCAEAGTALLSFRVLTPPALIQGEGPSVNLASGGEGTAAWIEILRAADLSRYTGLFPVPPPSADFDWALRTATMIERLRSTLWEGGYRLADVVKRHGGELEEAARWRDLAALETRYLERLAEAGLRDATDVELEQVEAIRMPSGMARITVAAVPDPAPLFIQALERMAAEGEVRMLVHAPSSLARAFDAWGRPERAFWATAPIEVPEDERNILLAGGPESQSRVALDVLAEEASRFGPEAVAIGVPDAEVTPYLLAALKEKGLPTYDPAGRPASSVPLYALMDAFRGVAASGAYAYVRTILRHPDVLRHLSLSASVSPSTLLTQLDRFQNDHLPLTLDDMARQLEAAPGEDAGAEDASYPALALAVAFLVDARARYRAASFRSGLLAFLSTVYAERLIDRARAEDAELIGLARALEEALAGDASPLLAAAGLGHAERFDLLLSRLADERFYPEVSEEALELEGWLELPWNDAPLLVVTGMNEGRVPDSRMSDAFLPDSLRTLLGLRGDADRLARDSYLMASLVASRLARGRVCFIAGKTGAAGDPLRPSRLLFRCKPARLPARAARLFGEVREERPNVPASVSFRLDVRPPASWDAVRLTPRRLSVTDFKAYLQCPFRFYLRKVLRMERLDDSKAEMDALDFGSVIHDALKGLADLTPAALKKEAGVKRFLGDRARAWVRARFGASPPLPVRMQLDAAIQRLEAAARVQAALTAEGWVIAHTERKFESVISGLPVSGKIDRIDVHPDSGRVRIYDYKSSDKPGSPEEAHLAKSSASGADYAEAPADGKPKYWIDLQLPLYRLLFREPVEGGRGPAEIGYFHLPKAVTETGVSMWADYDDALEASARRCAEGVVADVRALQYLPRPDKKIAYDPYEDLFPAGVEACIYGEEFAAFLERLRKKGVGA